jgi:hypothetical protein
MIPQNNLDEKVAIMTGEIEREVEEIERRVAPLIIVVC